MDDNNKFCWWIEFALYAFVGIAILLAGATFILGYSGAIPVIK